MKCSTNANKKNEGSLWRFVWFVVWVLKQSTSRGRNLTGRGEMLQDSDCSFWYRVPFFSLEEGESITASALLSVPNRTWSFGQHCHQHHCFDFFFLIVCWWQKIVVHKTTSIFLWHVGSDISIHIPGHPSFYSDYGRCFLWAQTTTINAIAFESHGWLIRTIFTKHRHEALMTRQGMIHASITLLSERRIPHNTLPVDSIILLGHLLCQVKKLSHTTMMRSLVLLLAFLSSTVAFAPSPSRVFSVAKFDVRPAQPLFMSSEEPTEETKISADGTYFDDEVSKEGNEDCCHIFTVNHTNTTSTA